MKTLWIGLFAAATVQAAELHVAVDGKDSNSGERKAPLRTIQRAADLAQPGDVVTVHTGLYRERVNPPRGGASDHARIVYQAAKGEKVGISGSEQVKGWEKVQDDTWKVVLPNTFFGKFNPYGDLIRGDWFDAKGRQHHSGAVYLNGEWQLEAAKLDDVLKPTGAAPLWFGQVDATNTTLWAQFKSVDPNEQLVEINVRQTVFFPEKTGINYITVRGFNLSQAATPWAPPTALQIGLIGTHWSKGWIIEGNVISHSRCVGVALGKYGDEWDNKAESAEGYTGTLNRALKNGWNKKTVGSHIVRNNTISHCEQNGIVGSLGAAFSTVTGNTIHDIHVQCLFAGFEMGAVKFHGAIDCIISRNHIYRSNRGIWLDWMAQGSRVSGNLLHDNQAEDLFLEVNHGPLLVDHNIMLSKNSILSASQGTAFVHNLLGGALNHWVDERQTPFHKPHSTEVAGMHDNPDGDDRYYNNLIVQSMNLAAAYDAAKFPVSMDGNVFLKGAVPCKIEKNPLVDPAFDPAIQLVEKKDGWYLQGKFDPSWRTKRACNLINTERLGKTVIAKAAYEQADGSPLSLNTDYFGTRRDPSHPFPGPFERPGADAFDLKIW